MMNHALNQYVAELLTAENQPDQARSYVYDANGNLLEDDVYRYTYNWRNLITEVHWLSDDQLAARYAYDALGRRVSKYDASSGAVTQFIYDGWQVLEERDGAGNLLASYAYAELDAPISMTRGEATYYYHTNHQGSVIAMSGADGTVIERYSYDPFGTVSITLNDGTEVGSSQIDNPYFYTARRYDPETDLYHYRHRYYSARLGRFLQRDPLGYVDGENLYAYVANNPIRWTDPYGLILTIPMGPEDGSYDLSIPDFVPVVGGAELSFSMSVSTGIFNLSSTGQHSILAPAAVGVGIDFSLSNPLPDYSSVGSVQVGYGENLGVGLEFSRYEGTILPSGISGGVGLTFIGGFVQTSLAYSQLEHMANGDKQCAGTDGCLQYRRLGVGDEGYAEIASVLSESHPKK